MSPPVERHEELLTAYLDGEVTAEERAVVQEWIEADPTARALLGELAAVRRSLRSLPDVVVPIGTYEQIGRNLRRGGLPGGNRSRGPWLSAAAAAAVVLAVAVSLAVPPPAEATVPPVHEMMVRHQDMADGKPPANGVAMPMDPVPMAEAEAMGGLPAMDALAGMPRDHVFQGGDTMQVVYKADDHMLSVYAHHGAVDWNGLPTGGTMLQVDGDKAWELREGDASVIVVERGADVFTIVAEVPPDDLMAAAKALPADGMGVGERFREVLDGLAAHFRW